jgi:hypothetical protein
MVELKRKSPEPPIISESLELPDGYQRWDWYKPGENPNGVWLNDVNQMTLDLQNAGDEELYLYTQHEIFCESAVIKQTRTTPNWEGGVVTFCNCKHLMRTYTKETWRGIWIAGLCPRDCVNNTFLFVGRIEHSFDGNYTLGQWLAKNHPAARRAKLAHKNPRGDVYDPQYGYSVVSYGRRYHHDTFTEPVNHCRAVETYKKSPGSTLREDGTVPKWWRDLEYVQRGTRPPVFVLSPCFLFSRPLVWTSLDPKRAALRITAGRLAGTLVNTAPR